MKNKWSKLLIALVAVSLMIAANPVLAEMDLEGGLPDMTSEALTADGELSYDESGEIVLSKKTITAAINLDEEYQLVDSNGEYIQVRSVSYSPEGIVEVDVDGHLTPMCTGTVKVNLKTNGSVYVLNLTVLTESDVESVSITTTDSNVLSVGETLTIDVSFMPANAESDVTWRIGNRNVLSVDEECVVTAMNPGITYVAAMSDNGKVSNRLYIKVREEAGDAPDGVAIDETRFPGEAFREHVRFYYDMNCDEALSEDEIARVADIDLTGEEYDNLKGMELFHNVDFIFLRDMTLPELDLSGNPKVTEIYIENVTLPAINLPHNPQLKYLTCRVTGMTTLDISHCPELMALVESTEPETVDGGTRYEGEASLFYADGITLIAEAPVYNVVTLPADLVTIEEQAFMGIDADIVIVPDSCETIGSRAFANCPNLFRVEAMEGIDIAEDAFDGCAYDVYVALH